MRYLLLSWVFILAACNEAKAPFVVEEESEELLNDLIQVRFGASIPFVQKYHVKYDSAGVVWMHHLEERNVNLDWDRDADFERGIEDSSGTLEFETNIRSSYVIAEIIDFDSARFGIIRDSILHQVFRDESEEIQLITDLKHSSFQADFIEGYWHFKNQSKGGRFTSQIKFNPERNSYLFTDFFTLAPHTPEIADSLHQKAKKSLSAVKFYQ